MRACKNSMWGSRACKPAKRSNSHRKQSSHHHYGSQTTSPSRMVSSSLHPVVMEIISERCCATIAAVVKPMGVSL
eukprot:364743-Chlamydomonas_euryale.AAC.13